MKKLTVETDNGVIVNDPEFQFASSSCIYVCVDCIRRCWRSAVENLKPNCNTQALDVQRQCSEQTLFKHFYTQLDDGQIMYKVK